MRIPNLISSTLILFISNLCVRFMGFIYKIFLSRSMDEFSLGIYHMVFNLLMIFISLTTTGIPTSLSCLISKKKAINDKHKTNTFFISALYISFFIAIVISSIICLYSNFIAIKVLKDSRLNIYVLAIAPAITLITISNILRGYYYGIKKVMVPAIGQFIEQLARMLFVILVIYNINNPSINCLIALLGISIGEIINIIFITINLSKDSSLDNKYIINIKDFVNSSIQTLKMSIPITCNKMSTIIIQAISSMIIPSRLVLSGFTYSKALSIYGIISGMVFPFVFLPLTLGSALVINLIPSISQELALRNYSSIRKKINFSILLTLVVGVFSSLFFHIFAYDICLFLFKNKLAGEYLKSLSILPLFLSLNHTISGILHSIGKEYICSFNTIVCTIAQFIGIYFLTALPSLNIYGYIYSLNIFPIITFILNLIVLLKTAREFNN